MKYLKPTCINYGINLKQCDITSVEGDFFTQTFLHWQSLFCVLLCKKKRNIKSCNMPWIMKAILDNDFW